MLFTLFYGVNFKVLDCQNTNYVSIQETYLVNNKLKG
jgi:hypothetical protein